MDLLLNLLFVIFKIRLRVLGVWDYGVNESSKLKTCIMTVIGRLINNENNSKLQPYYTLCDFAVI